MSGVGRMTAVPASRDGLPRAAALLLAACGAAGSAAAAGLHVPMQVLVVGRAAPDVQAAAASEGVVLREQVENRPWLRPAEVLETVPGLIVTQHTGDGKGNQYFLRGFNLDHGTDIAIRALGLPVNVRSHAHGQGYADLNWLIPELVAGVAYRKGPYRAADGDFATAGAVELDYVDRLAQPLTELGVGPDGWRRALAAGSWALEAGELLLAAEAGAYDGPWSVAQGLRRRNIVARLGRGGPQQGWRLTAVGYRSHWTATDQIPERALRDARLRRFDSLDPSSGGATRLSALMADAYGDNAWGGWRAAAFAAAYRLDLYSNFTYALDDAARGDQFRQLDDRRRLGIDARQRWHWQALGGEHAASAGLQWQRDHAADLRLELTQARVVHAAVRRDRVVQSSTSAFVDQASQWTPWLRTRLGLRADRFDFDVRSDTAANSGRTEADLISPKASIVVQPAPGWSLHANWGRGFHSNDARGTVIAVDPDPRSEGFGEAVDRVTPLARARGLELGAAHVTPTLQLSAAVWRLALDSELVYVGDAGATEAGGASVRRGVELAAVWQPSTAWVLDADASATRARFADSGAGPRCVEGALRRTASAGLTWQSDAKASFALRLRHLGPRQLDEACSRLGASSTLVNAHASWQLAPALRFAVEILNVFDRRFDDMEYLYESRLPGEAEPVLDRHLHPGEGRTLRLLLRWSGR